MPQRDYRSAANQLAAQKNAQNDNEMSQLFDALVRGAQAKQLQQQQYALKQQGQDADIAKLKGMIDQGLVPEGGGAKVGDTSFSRGYDPNRNLHALGSEAQRLRQSASKVVDPIAKQAEALELTHEFLDNPSSFDQKKLAVLQARFVEGPGQRLLDSVIQSMGGGANTLQGGIQDKINWFTGQAQQGLSPQQRNAMRESLFKYQTGLERDSNDAVNKFKAYAPSLAPLTAANGSLDGLVNAEIGPISSRLSSLQQRQSQYKQQAGGNTQLGMTQPQYQQTAPQAPTQVAGGFGDKLKSFLFGPQAGTSSMASQPPAAQTPAAPPSAAQPPSASGGLSGFIPQQPHPMAGKKVRDKVTGAIGTIDAQGNFNADQ